MHVKHWPPLHGKGKGVSSPNYWALSTQFLSKCTGSLRESLSGPNFHDFHNQKFIGSNLTKHELHF